MLKISNMKHGNDEFDIRIMPNAIDRRLTASFAERTFVRCPLNREDRNKKMHKKKIKNINVLADGPTHHSLLAADP